MSQEAWVILRVLMGTMRCLWVRPTTMWVSRERFLANFRREEKEKSDFTQEDDKEKREGKVFERARLLKSQCF